jgi:anti-sigma factor ChrR (cupin superfamily)
VTPHVQSLLPELVVGALDDAAVAEVLSHLAACASCAAERGLLDETLGRMALALPPGAPPAGRELVVAAVAPGATLMARLAPYRRRLSRLFDLGPGDYEALVGKAERGDEWLPVLPGMRILPFAVGPNRVGGDASLVRFDAGTRFPRHRHVGDELMFFLEGGIVDDDSGRAERPGDALFMPGDSVHCFTADEDCLCGVLIFGGGPVFLGA